jgi:hypothetical protein
LQGAQNAGFTGAGCAVEDDELAGIYFRHGVKK